MELSSSFLLAPSLRPLSNLLLRILLFLLLLWPNASVCRCTGALTRLKDEWKRTHVETNVPRKLTVTARTIFPPPHKAQIVSEGESQGRQLYIAWYREIGSLAPLDAPMWPKFHASSDVREPISLHQAVDTGGGFTRKHDRRGPKGQLPCILDRQRRLPRTLRDHVRSASALSALKKSLVANLSAKRQLSVAKPSAKRIFSLAKRDFLVANGRMAADFSSPAIHDGGDSFRHL